MAPAFGVSHETAMTDVKDETVPTLLALLKAFDRYYGYADAEDDEGRRVFREVERWFASADADDPRGFLAVCATLGLDPERIRRTLTPEARERWGD